MLKAAALLKGRNAALKEREPDRSLVEVLTEQLIAVQEPIVRYRTMYVASLNGVLPEVYSTLRGEKTDCTLVYRSFVRDDGAFPENARKAYRDALEGDILRHSTSVGIHREDFSFRLNGRDVAEFGSQGENRLAALSLKLSPFFLIEEMEKKPICVLDDVTSELDAQNAGRLLDYLKRFGQSFLTATDLTLEGASVIEVANHSAKRRN